MKSQISWIVLAILGLYVAAGIVRPPASSSGFNLADAGRLPVMMSGRVQPLDSVARVSLLQIRGTPSVPETGGARFWRAGELQATEWLLELLMKPDAADARPIFR